MGFLLMKQSSATDYNILLTPFFIIIIYLSVCTTKAARIKLPEENGTFPALIAFGDSILDTGNNNDLLSTAKCNFPPYGINFIGKKPTGRFCDGELLTDIIAQGLGIKEAVPAYHDPNLHSKDLLTGVCFASSGSGLDPLTALQLHVISLQGQYSDFKEYIEKLKEIAGEEKAKKIISDCVYLLSAGNNDIAITYFSTPSRIPLFSIESYTTRMITWTSTFIQDLHTLGVRRVAVLSTIPLGCLPGVRTQRGGPLRHCSNDLNEAALQFNSKLSSSLKNLNSFLPQANIVYVDVFTPLFDLINNPERTEFSVRDRGCCGTGTMELGPLCTEFTPHTCSNASDFLFWDSVHPSERANKIIASPIVKNLKSSFS